MQLNLTQGNITNQIIKLALPIIGSSLFFMLYNLTNLFWIGMLSANAVSAVGIVGYIVWFVLSIALMLKVGVEVLIAQSVGRNDELQTFHLSSMAIKLSLVFSLFLFIVCFFFVTQWISLFQVNNSDVTNMAEGYLRLMSISFLFSIPSFIATGIFTGLGNSRTPFVINVIGVCLNCILDPVLIHGYIFIKPLGIEGAAIATVISQIFVVVMLYFLLFKRNIKYIFYERILKAASYYQLGKLLKIGTPVAIQSVLFSVFAMIVARIVNHWGAKPLAVITIGANIEAISWMTASGFSTALGTFVGQNFGAGNFYRIKKGYYVTLLFSCSIGFVAGLFFLMFPGIIFEAFASDEIVLQYGIQYLKIIAISQVFMCVEFTSSGVFNGCGKTLMPAFIGVIFNGIRVLAIFIFVKYLDWNISSVWWCISLSSVLKGSVLCLLLYFFLLKPNKMIL